MMPCAGAKPRNMASFDCILFCWRADVESAFALTAMRQIRGKFQGGANLERLTNRFAKARARRKSKSVKQRLHAFKAADSRF